jgi:aminopeptidase-like protein
MIETLNIFKQILQLHLGVAQKDNSRLFSILNNLIPLDIVSYPSGSEVNGWVIPNHWSVDRAFITKNGERVYEWTGNPLSIATNSCSFEGEVPWEVLQKKIFTKKELPQAVPYHCSFSYRSWLHDWGFCIPWQQMSHWYGEGRYRVELQTQKSPSEMLVGVVEKRGESSDTVVFNAHTCHPLQFEDGLAGVWVITELFRWLQNQATRYTYKAVLAPEHFGTVFYLDSLTPVERQKLKACCFVEMVGLDKPFALQKSFLGNSLLDKVAEHQLSQLCRSFDQTSLRSGPFRTILGNDETVWEAPGYEIPCISISRVQDGRYYEEYHTDFDTIERSNPGRLLQTLEALKQLVLTIENDRVPQRNFSGLVALSHPRYDLYVNRYDPTVPQNIGEVESKMGVLQDWLPRLLDGKFSVFQIAQAFDVPFEYLLVYLRKFEEKGLVLLDTPPSFSYHQNILSESKVFSPFAGTKEGF